MGTVIAAVVSILAVYAVAIGSCVLGWGYLWLAGVTIENFNAYEAPRWVRRPLAVLVAFTSLAITGAALVEGWLLLLRWGLI